VKTGAACAAGGGHDLVGVESKAPANCGQAAEQCEIPLQRLHGRGVQGRRALQGVHAAPGIEGASMSEEEFRKRVVGSLGFCVLFLWFILAANVASCAMQVTHP
jgi:hypothetical protein